MGATLLTLLREVVTHTHTHPLTLPLTLPLLLHAHTRNGSLHAAMLLGDQATGSRLRGAAALLTLLREAVTHTHVLTLPLLLSRWSLCHWWHARAQLIHPVPPAASSSAALPSRRMQCPRDC